MATSAAQKEYLKKWYQDNKGKVAENRKRRASAIREYQKTWFSENPDYQRKRYAEKREESILYVKDWQGKNPKKVMLSSAKMRAKRKGLEFDLTIEDFDIPTHCPALGIELVRNGGHVRYNSACLDRIDVTKGYVKGNVVVVSDKANRIKSDATIAEIEAVIGFYKSRR